ncbi:MULTISPECIES: DUF4405 domain-containing protein [unclassified Ruegeria]|jgi:ABC-type Fe3+-siderophore transport system permease subunit|uniref:DUF4405 domain-containing protein n=1 Tax=unclassified Ruegeria TaxID=2625375 RepID=UPI00149183C4|nr:MULTISPECIES: DUF4405 domain-containing protein [unclassified Ruegeria]MBO9448263.1 DUF4405 domain-containing protein [Ruegeria sp. R14_0]NOD90803.1 DUF4405 domain-containing protein [Ruegeria sp. HKCCD4318]NOE16105.1 DUF4405 domain-containing protein [Ruegeria sp. HKCCD4318-2]NOG11641.1 DUF4405 domain-containing protein [Ruegeria sp. HKCCD4315]UUV08523.1 DUF4405 domain-containing protein [Ruegeria sp. YS9]
MANAESTARVKTKISGRAMAVFGVTFSFLAMLVSGGILFFAPIGKISNATDWQVLGLDRQGWDDVHIALALLFVGFSLWHAALHIRTFKTLILGNRMCPQGHRIEAMIGAAFVIALVTLTVFGLPPANWLLDLNEFFKHEFWAG